MTPPQQKASAFLAVEVNTEGDVQLDDHEEDDLSPQTPLSLPAVESGDSSQKSSTSAAKLTTEAEEITPESDLSRIPRRIWIVTTAALPWRTGTAVNPLLRALTLVQAGHTVSLLIPWLEAVEARKALYGNKDKNEWFETSTEQEAWIRRYCVERCNASQTTADQLQIQFWPGVYHESFGSIFPTEDICSLIPRDEADVCILEEPEHLNWFRVPNRQQQQQQTPASRRNSAEDNDNKHGESSSPKKSTGSSSPSENINASTEGNNVESDDTVTSMAAADVELLGWAFKFRHVVGILHTNYADYVRQYGLMGTSILTATALNSLSSMVVKAYCHRVIRLSATLPHLDKTKEVTCNVHGVRHEFLERPAVVVDEKQAAAKDGAACDSEHGSTSTSQSEETPKSYAAVYFIGKLIWAKGFENVLHVEEKYKAETGEYFAMDIYGGGNDEKEIRKAFFGRHHGKFTSRSSSTVSDSSASSGVTKEKDQKAAAVFDTKVSLRDQLCGFGKDTVDDDNDFTVNTSAATTATEQQQQSAAGSEESTSGRTTPVNANPTTAEILATPTVASPPMSPASAATEEPLSSTMESTGGETLVTPLEIFGDLSGKTLSTSVDTADAALKLIEKGPLAFHIAPAKTRFKWRRNPIPARFLGVQDHIVVRDIPDHKIFLNMSTSEVLCTTSAEALAMGKFVILPKHPSNEFFLQFPNCLAYETIDQCVLKLQYALENTPEPLTDNHKHKLSWKGATERLIKASAITKHEAEDRIKRGLDKADLKAARFHVDAAKKSHYVGNLIRGKILK